VRRVVIEGGRVAGGADVPPPLPSIIVGLGEMP
jgi:hypothetical protein